MTPPRSVQTRRVRTAIITAGLAIVAWYVVRSLGAQWAQLQHAAATLHVTWGRVALATVLVLATYALLIQSWRSLVTGWGGRLTFWNGARIWTVSNLARYLPGALWSVGAMGVMADDAGVPPATAAGAAILNMLLNLGAGFVVLAVAGQELVARLVPGVPAPQVVGPLVGLTGVLLLPLLIPRLAPFAARMLRRAPPAPLPFRAFAAAFAANIVAWCTYGIAFGCFAHALRPGAGDNWRRVYRSLRVFVHHGFSCATRTGRPLCSRGRDDRCAHPVGARDARRCGGASDGISALAHDARAGSGRRVHRRWRAARARAADGRPRLTRSVTRAVDARAHDPHARLVFSPLHPWLLLPNQ